MYYEEQWIEGALCWRTSPYGAWTRYTANELAHRYESAEKRAAAAQATVEALQAVIRQMGEQAAVLAKDGMAAKAQVEALQRVRDEFERERDQLHAALMEAKAALDAEREKMARLDAMYRQQLGDRDKRIDALAGSAKIWMDKLTQLQALVRAKEDAYEKILLSRERLEREMRGYPPVDNEGIPMVWQEPVGWVKRHPGRHDASNY